MAPELADANRNHRGKGEGMVEIVIALVALVGSVFTAIWTTSRGPWRLLDRLTPLVAEGHPAAIATTTTIIRDLEAAWKSRTARNWQIAGFTAATIGIAILLIGNIYLSSIVAHNDSLPVGAEPVQGPSLDVINSVGIGSAVLFILGSLAAGIAGAVRYAGSRNSNDRGTSGTGAGGTGPGSGDGDAGSGSKSAVDASRRHPRVPAGSQIVANLKARFVKREHRAH